LLPEIQTALPLYAYRCTNCGNKFEKIQSFSAEPETVCPKCGNATLIRPLTAPRLNFKGAGWYVNDYASKGADSSSESGGESKPAESKEATKTNDTSKSNDKPAASSPAPSAPSTPAPTPKASSES
jgi:putative FmdB family regulatory protein